MKKKLLVTLLSFVMVVTMMPLQIFAQSNTSADTTRQVVNTQEGGDQQESEENSIAVNVVNNENVDVTIILQDDSVEEGWRQVAPGDPIDEGSYLYIFFAPHSGYTFTGAKFTEDGETIERTAEELYNEDFEAFAAFYGDLGNNVTVEALAEKDEEPETYSIETVNHHTSAIGAYSNIAHTTAITEAEYGDDVYLTAKADEGYTVIGYILYDKNSDELFNVIEADEVGNAAFEMPNIDLQIFPMLDKYAVDVKSDAGHISNIRVIPNPATAGDYAAIVYDVDEGFIVDEYSVTVRLDDRYLPEEMRDITEYVLPSMSFSKDGITFLWPEELVDDIQIILHARNANDCKVSFYDEEGEKISDCMVEDGTLIPEAKIPEWEPEEGKTAIWMQKISEEEYEEFDPSTDVVTEDLELHRVIKDVEPCLVSIDSLGGSPRTQKTLRLPYNHVLTDTDLPTPTWAGWGFVGWFTFNEETFEMEPVKVDETRVTKDMLIEGVWQEGNAVVPAGDLEYLEKVELKKDDGFGEMVDVYAADPGEEIHVKYTPNGTHKNEKFVVTVVGDQSEQEIEFKKGTLGGTFVMPDEPVTVNINRAHDVSIEDASSIGQHTKGVGYRINDKYYGGEGDTFNLTVVDGQEVEIVMDCESGYRPTNIKVTKKSGGEVTLVDNKFTMPSEDVYITAGDEIVNYNLTGIAGYNMEVNFYKQNAEGKIEKVTTANAGDYIGVTVTSQEPESNVNIEAEVTRNHENIPLEKYENYKCFYMPAENVTVAAYNKSTERKVTFDGDLEAGTASVRVVLYGEKVEKPTAPAGRDRTLTSWWTFDRTTHEKVKEWDFNRPVVENLYLVGQYTCTLTFDPGEGTEGDPPADQTVESGERCIVPDPIGGTLEKDGYEFKAWVGSNGEIFNFEDGIEYNKTIYPTWTAKRSAISEGTLDEHVTGYVVTDKTGIVSTGATDSKVCITPVLEEGYEVASIEIIRTDGEAAIEADSMGYFKMPPCPVLVNITTEQKAYRLAGDPGENVESIGVIINGGEEQALTTELETLHANDRVQIVPHFAEGYELDGIYVDTTIGKTAVELLGSIFWMPETHATVHVTAKEMKSSIIKSKGSHVLSVESNIVNEDGEILQVDATEAKVGELIDVVPSYEEGYEAKELKVVNNEGKPVETTEEGYCIVPAGGMWIYATAQKVQHGITIDAPEHATITTYPAETAPEGAEVKINTSTDVGYRISDITVTAGTEEIEISDDMTFTMPGEDVTIEAEVIRLVPITLDTTEHVAGFDVTPSGYAAPEEEVYVKAFAYKPYKIDQIKVTYTDPATEEEIEHKVIDGDEGTFEMIDEGISVDGIHIKATTKVPSPIRLTKDAHIDNVYFTIDGKVVTEAAFGEKVNVIVEPEIGYEVNKVTVGGEEVQKVDGQYIFTMPAHDAYVNVTSKDAADYKVEFDANGGTPTPQAQNVKPGRTATQPTNPTYTGHDFLGWFNTATGEKWNFSNVVKGSMVLQAHWKVHEYDVTFDANGGTPEKTTVQVEYGKTVPEPTETPTWTGHTFKGWYDSAEGGKEWNFEEDTITEDTTIYAQWTTQKCSVTFDPNHTGGAARIVTVDYGETVEVPEAPTREGYEFTGWYTQAIGGTLWRFEDPVTKTMTLYAHWAKEDEVTIVFNAPNGDPAIQNFTATKGSTIKDLEVKTPTRAGYTFNGWYLAGSEQKWKDTDQFNSNTELFAHWDANSYSINTTGDDHVVSIETYVDGKAVTEAKAGDEVVVDATFDEGYELDTISVTRTDTHQPVTVEEGVFVMPASEVEVNVTSTQTVYEIEIYDSPGVMSITTDPSDYAAEGKTVSVEAEASPSYEIDKIIVIGNVSYEQIAEITGEKGSFVMPGEGVTIAAVTKGIYTVITPTEYPEGVAEISVSPDVLVPAGEEVTIQVAADEGYKITNVIVDGVKHEGSTYTFTMPERNVYVNAEAAPIKELHFITVTKDANVDSVKVTVDGFPAAGAYEGDEVKVEPTFKAGYELNQITVNGEKITGNTFEMPDEDVTVNVTSKQTEYSIEKTIDAGVANVVFKVSGQSVTKAHYGETVTVEPTFKAGYELNQITVNGEKITGNTFEMPNEDVTVNVTSKALAPITPPTITGFSAKAENAVTAKVSWDQAKDSRVEYFLYKSTKPTGDFGSVYKVLSYDQNTFTDKDVKCGTKYYYIVRSAVKGADGKYSFGPYTKVDYAWPRVADVKGFSVWAPNAKSVKVAWTPTKNANIEYWIYRGTKTTGDWGPAIAKVNSTEGLWTDTTVKTGTKYYYMIRAVETIDGKSYFGNYTKIDYGWPR